MNTPFVRFVIVNVANTVLYYAIYLALRTVMPYLLANLIALLVAVVVAFVLNAKVAFRVQQTWRKALLFPLSNITAMVLRTAVIWLLVERLSMSEELAPLVAIAVTLPVTYVVTKAIMADRPGSTASV